MNTNRRVWSLVAALILTIAACASATGVPSPPPGTGLAISALAGPTCPVETIPPDPACAPRPVAGAKVVILDAQDREAAVVVLDAKGSAAVTLAAGKYVIKAQPAAGLMGTPEAMDAAVVDGKLTPVALSYDTGIR